MPQISPMNWMMIFFFFVYSMMYLKKNMIHEKFDMSKKSFKMLNYVK